MTQDQLDLCALGITIARLQLKVMAATATALNDSEGCQRFMALEGEFEVLATQIQTGKIRGSDAGQA